MTVGKSWRVALLALPFLLVGLWFVLDPLGAACSDDLLDNPDYSCNLGGEIAWALYIAIPLSVVGALVALVALATWRRRR